MDVICTQKKSTNKSDANGAMKNMKKKCMQCMAMNGEKGERPKTAEEKDKYHDFMRQLNKEEKRGFLKISRWAIRPLINEKNKKIKQKAIISISKALKTGKHPITGRYTKKKLTQKDIKAVLKKIRDEVRSGLIVKEMK